MRGNGKKRREGRVSKEVKGKVRKELRVNKEAKGKVRKELRKSEREGQRKAKGMVS